MGSAHADLEPEVGVAAALEIILEADQRMNGKFKNIHVKGWENVSGPNRYDGLEVPW